MKCLSGEAEGSWAVSPSVQLPPVTVLSHASFISLCMPRVRPPLCSLAPCFPGRTRCTRGQPCCPRCFTSPWEARVRLSPHRLVLWPEKLISVIQHDCGSVLALTLTPGLFLSPPLCSLEQQCCSALGHKGTLPGSRQASGGHSSLMSWLSPALPCSVNTPFLFLMLDFGSRFQAVQDRTSPGSQRLLLQSLPG